MHKTDTVCVGVRDVDLPDDGADTGTILAAETAVGAKVVTETSAAEPPTRLLPGDRGRTA
jgi:hypothetical protein